MDNPSVWQIFKKALSHFLDSKTNFGLFWLSILGFIGFLIIAAVWGTIYFEQLLYFLGFNGGSAVTRASIVDGVPKIAASWQNPNSIAANPPPAVSPIQPPTAMAGTSAALNFDPNNRLR